MATNPMQRKARLSFILGMLVMLVLCGAVIALLFVQLTNYQKKEKESAKLMQQVYVLNQDVSSGQVVTTDMLEMKTVNTQFIPSNATSDLDTITNYALQDKDGNDVYTKYDNDKNYSLYLLIDQNECQLKQSSTDNYYIEYINENDNNYNIYTKTSDDGNTYVYLKVGNVEYQLYDSGNNKVYIKFGIQNQDKFYTRKNNAEKEVEIQDLQFKNIGEISSIPYAPEKKYVELNTIPLIAKVTMNKNTVITKDLLAKGKNQLANDVRKQEYNSFILPMDLVTGDYVDVRLMLPSGQDYIVVSKKEVEIPNINGEDSLDTVWMNVSEDEILTISSAIVDAYKITGSKLYVTKYTEAGLQEAATPTYVVSAETATLLNKDPNILAKAITALKNRYSSIGSTDIRKNNINKAIEDEETPNENLNKKMQESITNSQDSRKSYLDSLSGAIQ